jgi:hypothetical protein
MAAAADSHQPGYSAAPSSCTTAVVRGTPASFAVCQTQSVAMEWLPPAEGFQCWPHILVVATCLTVKATPHSGRSVTAVGTVGCRSDNQGHLGAPRLSVVVLCQHGSCKHHNPTCQSLCQWTSAWTSACVTAQCSGVAASRQGTAQNPAAQLLYHLFAAKGWAVGSISSRYIGDFGI